MPDSIQFNPGRHLQAEHPWPSLHSSQAFRRCLACQRDPSNPMRCDTGGILWSLKKSLKSITMVSHNFKASSCDNVSSWFSQTHFLPDPLVVRLCSVCMSVIYLIRCTEKERGTRHLHIFPQKTWANALCKGHRI